MLNVLVGGYRITHKLAEGGMGVVFAARHEIMERDAVVKVLHEKHSRDQDLVTRFFNEAKAAARIRHPGIVDVFDVGFVDDRAYLVMERLRGANLREILRRGPLAPDKARSLLRQLAGALGAAHGRDIVHRDLKPENIFVVPDPDVPGGERVKVLDFGIAKLAAPRAGPGMTEQGSVFGTPAYMAPEQWLNAATVDHRADLYALGCILYEMLCGEPPFGAGGLELLASHVRDDPAPLAVRCPDVPSDLSAIAHTLLAKEPIDRFASCEALAAALAGADMAELTGAATDTLSDFRSDPSMAAFAATVPPRAGDASEIRTGEPDASDASPTGPGRDDGDRNYATAPTVSQRGRPAPSAPTEPPAAELEEPRTSDRSVHSHRGVWAVVAVAVLALAVTGVLAVRTGWLARDEYGANALDGGVDADQPRYLTWLATARDALAEERWEHAIESAKRAEQSAPADDPVREDAAEVVARAVAERRTQLWYENFADAIRAGEVPAWTSAFRAIPESSVYHGRASSEFEQAKAEWIAPVIAKVEKLAGARKCAKIAEVAAEVALVFPDETGRVDSIEAACRAALPRPSPRPSPPPLPERVDAFTIRKILGSAEGTIRACANTAGIEGSVIVTAFIMPDGTVKSWNISSHRGGMRQCVGAVVKSLRFPPAQNTSNGSYSVFLR